MMPASTNDSQTAAPATSPAAPNSEKMPAPTIAPTPMNAACVVETYLRGGEEDVSAFAAAATGTAEFAIVLTLRGHLTAATAAGSDGCACGASPSAHDGLSR